MISQILRIAQVLSVVLILELWIFFAPALAGSRFPNALHPGSKPMKILAGDYNQDGQLELLTLPDSYDSIDRRIMQIITNDGKEGIGAIKEVAVEKNVSDVCQGNLDGDAIPDPLVALERSVYPIVFESGIPTGIGKELFMYEKLGDEYQPFYQAVQQIDLLDRDGDGLTETLAVFLRDAKHLATSVISKWEVALAAWNPEKNRFEEYTRIGLPDYFFANDMQWMREENGEPYLLFFQDLDKTLTKVMDVFGAQPRRETIACNKENYPKALFEYTDIQTGETRQMGVLTGEHTMKSIMRWGSLGDSGFVGNREIPLPFTECIPVDWNRDGYPDLAGYFQGSKSGYLILPGIADGFDIGVRLCDEMPPLSPYARPITGFLAEGDINEDGISDRVVSTYNSDSSTIVSVNWGRENGTYEEADSWAGEFFEQVALYDFDRDGHLDWLLVHAEGNDIRFRKGNGQGQFAEPVVSEMDAHAGSPPILGDFNGDDMADLLFTNGGTDYGERGVITLVFGRGDGTFYGSESYLFLSAEEKITIWCFGGQNEMIHIVDANRDGLDDVWFGDWYGHPVHYLWLNDGVPLSAVTSWETFP